MKLGGKKQKFISLKEAAKLSGYASDYIGYLIRKGKISGKKIYSGVTWITTEETLKEYKEKKKVLKKNIKKKNIKEKKQIGKLIYDIFPPDEIKKIAKEVAGIKKYKSEKDKILALSWRFTLTVFLIICFLTGFAPIKFIKYSIEVLSQDTKTENFNLYTKNCTGDWQNIENVLGEPEVGADGNLDSFSETNSAVYETNLAVYNGGSSYLICQSFERKDEQKAESLDKPIEEGTTTEGIATTTITTESTTTESTTTESTTTETAGTESATETTTEATIPEENNSENITTLFIPASTETETTTEELPTSFLDKIKSSFRNLRILAQEEEQFESARIKFSFAIKERELNVLPIEETTKSQAFPNSDQETTASDEIIETETPNNSGIEDATSPIEDTTSSEEVISFWNKIKNFFGNPIIQAEENTEENINEPVKNATTDEAITTNETTTTDEIIENEQQELTEEQIEEEQPAEEQTVTSAQESVQESIQESDLVNPETTNEKKDLIIVWYSLDGEIWWKLGSIYNYPLSNALNGGYFEYDAPFLKKWDDIKKLKIKFEGANEKNNIVAYLDNVWLEINYQEEEKKEKEENKEEYFNAILNPDFENGQIKKDIQSENIRAVILEKGGSLELWYYDSTPDPNLNSNGWILASGISIDYYSPLAIKDRTIFWIDQNKQNIFCFNIDEKSLLGISINQIEESYLEFKNKNNEKWQIIISVENEFKFIPISSQ